MKIIDISIRRRVTVAMFTIGIILFGFVSFNRLKINLLPDLNYPTLTIRTEYTGAAPVEVENLISKPIEEALGIVKNVQQVRSISRSGQSDVMLEFAWGTNMDFASLDVREKLDALELPLEIKKPIILRFDPSLDPVMRFALYRKSDQEKAINPEVRLTSYEPEVWNEDLEEDLKYLRRLGDEQIKKGLESAQGVAAVKISGGLEDEIQVWIDQERLAQLNIPVETLVNVLAAENVNLSGGRLEEGKHQYLVRTLNQFQSVDEINNVIVAQREGKPIYIRDIASVAQGYKEREAITRIDGREAVEVAIYKEGDANTVSVARAVMNRLDRLREILPKDVEIDKVYDQSVFIVQAVDEVVNAGIIGGILAIIILYFFLRNFWTTMIISLSIPVSVIATFNVMYGMDITLNIMSLGGIALGIGLLVDNSIVVLENIARHREQGKDGLTAARDGASEVGTAVIASTLTTVAVFFPLVFVRGIAGQLFRDQAMTVTFALLASLIVAMTLIPMLASWGWRRQSIEVPAKKMKDTKERSRFGKILFFMYSVIPHFLFTTVPTFILRYTYRGIRGISKLILKVLNPLFSLFTNNFNRLENWYPKAINWALDNKAKVITTAVIMFVAVLFIIPQLGVELIPQLSQGEFNIEFKLPPGTPLEKTDGVIAYVQQKTRNLQKIETSFAVAGTGNRLDANPEQGGENWGELSIQLKPGSNRMDEDAAMSDLRTELAGLPGVNFKFERPSLFSFRTPVEIEIVGFNLSKLKSISKDITQQMSGSDRFADIKSTIETGHPEIQIIFDRERAAVLGLAVYQVADRVVSKVRGTVATRYSWHDRKIDVMVRSREQDRASIKDIRKLIVNPESERPVTLDEVATVVEDIGPGEIHRISQERVAIISANLNYGDLGTAAVELQNIIDNTNIPTDIQVRLAGQNEEMAMSFRSLQFALLLAIFLVYLVMASQFESFLHPFVIIFTIPLALIGAVLALWVTGSTISVVVFIGLILLAGIVVNNAIVLIDLINKLRAKGMDKAEAIIEGGRSRLRPILMTTLTTVLGLLPLAMGFGEGAEVRAPMAITVIGGLAVSTLLTLIVIPVVYAIMDRKKFVQV
jgi:HAE1 family hydrophobic/amphiphilic exporter-1